MITSLPKPLLHPIDPLKARPLGGTGPSGYYAGNDFRNAYVPGTTLNGAGQSVGLLEFSAYYKADITNYEKTIGVTSYVPLNNVVIGNARARHRQQRRGGLGHRGGHRHGAGAVAGDCL